MSVTAAALSPPRNAVYAYIGQRIKERRKLLKLSQMQLAQLMDVSYQQIQKYESGVTQVSVGKLLRFSRVLNVTPAYFYEGVKLEDRIGKGIDSDIIQRYRTGPFHILLVEDNPGDVILFKKAVGVCAESVDVHVLHDADIVMDFLQNHTVKYGRRIPDLMILDLSLPKTGGMQLLKLVKKNPKTRDLPVVVLTDSISVKEMQEAYRQGASGFIQKSVDVEEYTESVRTLIKYWARVVVLPHV